MSLATATLSTQRSFTADWLISGDTLTLPQGIITDLMIVTRSTYPVYLGRLSIVSGILYLSLEQNGVVCAYGEVSEDNSTVALQVFNDVVSASVTVGAVSNVPDVLYTPTEAQISPELVAVVGDIEEGRTTLTLTQDGESTSYVLENDVSLSTDSNLTLTYNGGAAQIAATDSCYMSFINLSYPLTVTGTTTVTSINNVKSKTGVIRITISTDNNVLPAVSDGYTITIDGKDITLCGNPGDLIDNKISPSLHAGTVYKPLDDLYVDGVRDTKMAFNWYYGISNTGLAEIDPNIDVAPVSSEGSEG